MFLGTHEEEESALLLPLLGALRSLHGPVCYCSLFPFLILSRFFVPFRYKFHFSHFIIHPTILLSMKYCLFILIVVSRNNVKMLAMIFFFLLLLTYYYTYIF